MDKGIQYRQSISDGGRTLVSGDGRFELGFFSLGSSKNRNVGICYKKVPVTTVVWVANRINPINDSSGVLMINSTGNLVLRDEQSSGGSYLRQSFDYPSDTLLPEMKLGWDLKTGLERLLSSWRIPDDPSPGDFTCGVELQGNPEIVMWKGSNRYLRERLTWSETTQNWNVYSYVPRDYCDSYGVCGAYGNCIATQLPICQCLEGFKPKSTGFGDWYEGCVRNKALNYSKLDGFIKFNGLKWPDATNSWVNKSMNLKQCRVKCLENSSCMAYSNLDIRGRGSSCAMWFGDLIDIKQVSNGVQDLFIRMSALELDEDSGDSYCHCRSCWGAFVLTAWKLWKEGRPLELTDPFLGESCNESEAKRCIHISLSCLEHQPDNRPSMSSVVLMLGSDNALPDLKQPGFLMDRKNRILQTSLGFLHLMKLLSHC
ncbi:hypothetical protein EZV62_008551 [Acer yangbiense]|uniref:Apple domain-containing protein n=1 Tax=Acer yangbiense TaxID=1000413 RepID=A0A5C7IFQ2_9ROSI|nr:hypothetical protein EZV62_008551 [Acer yangbiense]